MKAYAAVLAAAFQIGGGALASTGAFAQDEKPIVECIEILPNPPVSTPLTLDTGDFSPSTGEMFTGPACYLSAFFELTDPGKQAMFGAGPTRMLIFTTTGGQYVVRFLDRIGDH